MVAATEESGAPRDAESVDIGILDETLSFFIRSINTAVTRDLDARMRGLDIARGTGKITTLFLVENHPGIRPSVIADVLFKDRSAMGRLLDDMAAAGILRREAATEDLRAQALHLTDKGSELADTVRGIVRDSRQFFGATDASDYAEVVRLLRKIYWRLVANRGLAA
jgi:DNA-binding MarR family transcriptional regulator